LDYKTFSAQEIINIESEKNLLTQKPESAKKTLTRLNKEIYESKITSPLNGTVEELIRINEGDYIFSGTEILRIIPDMIEELKAELIISDKDIAELKIGMEVNLKFTALPPSEYGVFDEEHVELDLKKMNDILRERYPLLPIILYGHSMGSFFARWYASRYPDTIDGLITSGTAGPALINGLGRALAGFIYRTHKEGYISKLFVAKDVLNIQN